MRTVIAGSRSAGDIRLVYDAVHDSGFNITTVISGTAYGADKLDEAWATDNNIPIERYPADWNLHGKSAGYKRNVQMAEVADQVILLWDGESKGTKHMLTIAKMKGLPVFVYNFIK